MESAELSPKEDLTQLADHAKGKDFIPITLTTNHIATIGSADNIEEQRYTNFNTAANENDEDSADGTDTGTDTGTGGSSGGSTGGGEDSNPL